MFLNESANYGRGGHGRTAGFIFAISVMIEDGGTPEPQAIDSYSVLSN